MTPDAQDKPCERCETRHVPGEPCAPLQLCPECGRNGGGIPCGHYYDAIDPNVGNVWPEDDGW